MRLRSLTVGIALVLAVSFAVAAKAANPGVTLIGVGSVSGSALDLSGLDGHEICSLADATNCIDHATLGGFGSAMTHTGFDNVATPDRGPFDGRTETPFLDRFHFIRLTVDVRSPPFPNIHARLLDTRLLKARRRTFVGASSEFYRRFQTRSSSIPPTTSRDVRPIGEWRVWPSRPITAIWSALCRTR